MSTLHQIFFFVLTLAVLIVVHELGHFTAARLCGVKVLRFSLGFGTALLSKKFGPDRTEWVLAAIPLGGYVKMLDAREGPVDEAEKHRAFTSQSILKRSFIVAAGPVSNLLLAIAIYFCLACVGSEDLPAALGKVKPGTPAAEAGLRAGDLITSFNGVAVQGWTELRWQVVQHSLGHKAASLDIVRDGVAIKDLQINTEGLKLDERGPDPVKQLGFSMSVQLPAVIGRVAPGLPAEKAGIKVGDVVQKVRGKDISSWSEMTEAIVATQLGDAMSVSVLRDGRVYDLSVKPEPAKLPQPNAVAQFLNRVFGGGNAKPPRTLPPLQIGVGAAPMSEEALARQSVRIQYGPIDGGVHAVRQMAEMAVFDLHAFWNILTLKLSAKNISGPIAIADVAGQSASAGLEAYLSMIAALSVSLGVLNLLPIPILDGGHLLYYVSECIRGKAVSEQIEQLGQKIGLTILVLLMSLAFFNDLNRVIFG